MLDLVVHDATDGRRSSENLMRAMLDRFSGQRGFTSADVERTVLRAWIQPSDSTLRLLLFTPVSVWGRAGLHSGDRLLSVNGAPLVTPLDFRNVLERVSVGDTVRSDVERSSGRKTATVVVTRYDRVAVRILPDSQATERQCLSSVNTENGHEE